MDEQEAKIQALMKQHNLPQEVRHAAETIATLRLENKNLWAAMAKIQPQQKRLYHLMTTIVHACHGHEMRIHESQMLRLKDEYRLDERFDKTTREFVLKVTGLTEQLPPDAPEPEREFYSIPEMIIMFERFADGQAEINPETAGKVAKTLRALVKAQQDALTRTKH